jgi:PAS domain S-box-containing protein
MSSRADFSAALPLPRDKPDAWYRARPRSERLTVSRLCATLLMIGGSLVLTAWVVDLQFIKSLSPQWTTMKVNTAVCFILSGVALWHQGNSLAGPTARSVGLAAAALVLGVGFLTAVQFAFGVQLGIDELLLRQPAMAADYMGDGRMSPATAVAFVLLGTAFLCQAPGNSVGNRIALLLALVVGAVSLTTVIGYVYGVPAMHPTWPTSTMALHTAALFAIASVGILGAQADRSPLGILASEGTGSTIARRLLPLAIAVPVLIGWFALQGEEAGVYGLELGLMLLVVASVATFVLMIWVTATALNRADAIQQDAIQAIANEAMRRRVLFEQARDGILIFDADRNIVEANNSFANMLGYSLEEVMQLRPWDWDVKYNTRELFFEAWPELPKTSGQLETEFRRKQGDIIYTAISYSPAELDGESYLYCICRDITSRKRSDQALHESQERFRRALANIPDVVVIYDRELRIRFINNATRAVTGMRAADFIGRRDEEIFPPHVHEAYLPTLRKAISSKRICKVDTELMLPGDRQRALRITCVPLLDSSGEVREVLGITHDYTDRKKAEEKFRQSQSQYQELIEQAADGIFISDAEGKFVLVNSRCCELLGYSKDELLSMNGSETYLEEETDMTTRRLAKLSSGQDLRYERMVKRKDGSAFPAEVSVKMLEGGRMQVIFHDITSRRRQEQKIARLSRIHAVLSGINSAIVRIRKRKGTPVRGVPNCGHCGKFQNCLDRPFRSGHGSDATACAIRLADQSRRDRAGTTGKWSI